MNVERQIRPASKEPPQGSTASEKPALPTPEEEAEHIKDEGDPIGANFA